MTDFDDDFSVAPPYRQYLTFELGVMLYFL